MEFNPSNKVVQRRVQGMVMEEQGLFDDAGKCFLQAWGEAKYDFEKFISAYYVARSQSHIPKKQNGLRRR